MSHIRGALADLAEELCDPHRHVEIVFDTDRHRNRRGRRAYVTTQTGLLAQLADAMMPGGRAISDGGRGGSGAPPLPCDPDALSRHTAITVAAVRWAWVLRAPIRSTVEGQIRALLGAPMDSDTERALVADMRCWRDWAAIVTGWKTPPYMPHVPCPVLDCGRSGLRIDLERHTGLCVGCGATWSPDTIGLLAEYVKSYRGHTERSTLPESDALASP